MDAEDQRVARAIDGDLQDLEQLLREAEPIARSRLQIAPKWSRSFDVDDVLQVSFLEAFLRIGALATPTVAAFQAWFLRIAENNLIDATRSLDRARRPDANDRVTQGAGGESARTLLLQVAGGDTTAGGQAAIAEQIERMHAAIAELPESYRRVVQLLDLEQRPLAEVAEELGRSIGAVHMLRSRAHGRLAELVRAAN